MCVAVFPACSFSLYFHWYEYMYGNRLQFCSVVGSLVKYPIAVSCKYASGDVMRLCILSIILLGMLFFLFKRQTASNFIAD